MEWLNHLNGALDYLEQNLAGEIDYNRAANLACCSTFHFQRMFSYLAGVPLGEYLRRRRMTCAAFDLQNGEKVLDVALRYGYESPTAFNRAFQGVHGLPPSAAQKEGSTLLAYPRISFKITIKGEAEMEYRMEKKEAIRIVGVKASIGGNFKENFIAVPQLWQKAAEDGTVARLAAMINREPMGILGVSAGVVGSDNWEYYIAVATDAPAGDGLCEYTIPACNWAVFPGHGPMPTAIQELERCAATEWLPTSGYEYADAADIEVYLDANPIDSKFEVWIPVVKR